MSALVFQPIHLRADSAQALLDEVGVTVPEATRSGQVLVAGGCKLIYRRPQRIWLLYGYRVDGRDVLDCARVIADSRRSA